MTDLAAIVGALEREHRTNLPAHFLIAADHPARLECPTCALLADTPSVEPLERLAVLAKGYRGEPDGLEAVRLDALCSAIEDEYAALRPSVEPAEVATEELCGNPDPTGGRWTDYPCWRASGHAGKHESRSHVWADGETIHGEPLPAYRDKAGTGASFEDALDLGDAR